MKITPLLIGICLLSVITGCHKPKTDDVIGAAEAKIKATALAAIAKKYPDVSSSDLKFSSLSVKRAPDNTEYVSVTYDLPASAETNTLGNTPATVTKLIMVGMSLSGQVHNVYESTK